MKKLKRSKKLELLTLINAKLARGDIIEWITQNGIKNEKGEPMEFTRHKFLVEPYRDQSRLLACMKCGQIGFSTMAILKLFFLAHRKKLNCIHTLPTDDDVKKFAASKVNPIVSSNPCIKDIMIGETDNTYQKQVGDAFIFWQGTKGQSKGIMITSDINVHDEIDRSDMATVETYKSRLLHSDFKGEWVFSNPSRPNVGVDVPWQRSDKKLWHVTCESCRDEQPLDYFINIDKDRKEFVCRSCKAVITDEMRINGRWIATADGEGWSGYHISQLIAPWISAAELIEMEATTTQEYFYNFVLGLPVIGGANQVSRSIILQCCTDPADAAGRWKFLGVDVGKVLHCVQGTEKGITRVFTLPNWPALDMYVKHQGINVTVVDNAPETEEATKFVQRNRGRAYRCVYDYDDERTDMIEWSDIEQTKTIRRDKEGVVWAHRTRIIDHAIDMYDQGGIYVYIKLNDPQLVGQGKHGVIENCLCDHWETLYTVGSDGQAVNIVKKDRMGNVIRTWENAGPDHFAHANVYYEIARQRKAPTRLAGKPQANRQPDVPAVNPITGY